MHQTEKECLILAKPSGIKFEVHSKNVMSEGKTLLSMIPASWKKYKQFVNKDLTKLVVFVCEHHDDGKKLNEWQNPCKKDYH